MADAELGSPAIASSPDSLSSQISTNDDDDDSQTCEEFSFSLPQCTSDDAVNEVVMCDIYFANKQRLPTSNSGLPTYTDSSPSSNNTVNSRLSTSADIGMLPDSNLNSRQHTNSGQSLPNSSTLPLTSRVTAGHHYSHRMGGGSTGSISQGSSIGSVASTSGASNKGDSPLSESSRGSNCENQGKGDDSPLQDYMLVYMEIETIEQRYRYKDDFNREYIEYRQLRDKVLPVYMRFEHLKNCIDDTKEGSQAYEELYHQVLEEYKKCQSDRQFQLDKRRVNYLHNKLSYIKQLIIDYDLNKRDIVVKTEPRT